MIKILSIVILLSASVVHGQEACESCREDVLARPETLKLSDLDPRYQDVFVPRERILLRLNVPATRLDLYLEGELKKSFPVAVGMPRYPTPLRDYQVSMIIWNPWWIPPDSEWAKDAEKTPPGPKNPLGPVKLVMERGIRIHGTNNPKSIGSASSHACIRMHNADALELAWLIQTRYSDKTDPEFLEQYRKWEKKTHYVRLKEIVPVEVVYRQVERKGDRLLLHPNLYWRGGFKKELEAALEDEPVEVDSPLIKKLEKMRKKQTVEVPLVDLVARQNIPKTTEVSAGQSTLLDAPQEITRY